MSGKSRSAKQIGPIMNDQKDLFFDDLGKADVFNSFYSTIGDKLAEPFQLDHMGAVAVSHQTSSSLCSISLSDAAFQEKLKMINPKKAHGVDVITAREMKIVAEGFGPSLSC